MLLKLDNKKTWTSAHRDLFLPKEMLSGQMMKKLPTIQGKISDALLPSPKALFHFPCMVSYLVSDYCIYIYIYVYIHHQAWITLQLVNSHESLRDMYCFCNCFLFFFAYS